MKDLVIFLFLLVALVLMIIVAIFEKIKFVIRFGCDLCKRPADYELIS